MAKIKVRKDVAEQMTSKLKAPKKGLESANSVKNLTNFDNTGKLQANKNLFHRGQFDAYKIENMGVAPEGCVYDLDNPTEKFYYDLKMQFAKADDEVEKGFNPNTPRTYVTKMVTRNGKTFPKKIPYAVNTEKKKKHITKDVVDLTEQEKNNLIKLLTKEPTVIIDGIKVHRAKLNKPNKKQFEIELEQCKVLKTKGYDVFLLRENYGNGKIADTITNGSFLELKNTPENVGDNYSKGRSQGFNVFIKVDEPMTVETAIGEIFGKLKEKVKNHSKKIEGKVCLLMDKTNKYVELDINKKGHASINSVPLVIAKSIRVVTNSTWLNSILPQLDNLSSKNVTKSLTYSGHKLQGRTRLYGMDISIENKKGSYRSGVDKDGHKWKTFMHYDYGYIRGTVGTDKDHLDCYVGSDKEAQKVYVIHQNDPVTHKYDEDKCMLCFSSAADAKAAYMKQYDRPGFYGSMTTMTIEQFKSFIFSHKGKMVHKSFDINITDITENNKQQKLEQVNKALNAIADNRPFMIKHIPADSSTNYGNLLVRITDFDRSKIEKAVHKIALSLDADISGASKGETFVYKAQEELVDKYFKEFTNRTRAIYNFVIGYFDLPDIRIVSKASELRHKGKILYNPSTGLPIKESDWKKFVVELEKYLNRNYTGIGEKIVLSAESLGIILDRLSKTNSLDEIRKMSVADLKAKRYDVDWIGDSIKNMKDKFGDVISRERQARIQIAMDSAAQRVTRVKDDMRNNIQQIIIDGIRDKQSKSVVAQNLFDKCASLNRDMQRIADSEVQMAANSAYIQEEVYNSEPGSKVYFKRFEMMDDNTCKKCRKLNGTIVLWSDVPLPEERIKDPFAKYAIWDGKNDGDCPVGIVHPWCRGSWIRYYPEV